MEMRVRGDDCKSREEYIFILLSYISVGLCDVYADFGDSIVIPSHNSFWILEIHIFIPSM